MAQSSLNAVVVRIVMFAFGRVVGGCGENDCGGQKGCNITWGYVAREGMGRGRVGHFFFFSVGGSVSGSENLSRCAEKAWAV